MFRIIYIYTVAMKGSSIFPYIYSLRVFFNDYFRSEVPRWSPSLGPNHPGVRFCHQKSLPPRRIPKGGGIFLSKGPQNRGESSWEFLFLLEICFWKKAPIFFPANVSLEMLFFGEFEKLFPWFASHHGKWQRLFTHIWKPWRTTKIFVLKTATLSKNSHHWDTSCWSFREITRLVTLLSAFWDLKVQLTDSLFSIRCKDSKDLWVEFCFIWAPIFGVKIDHWNRSRRCAPWKFNLKLANPGKGDSFWMTSFSGSMLGFSRGRKKHLGKLVYIIPKPAWIKWIWGWIPFTRRHFWVTNRRERSL